MEAKWHQNSGCGDGFHPGRHPLCRSSPSHGRADHRRPQLVADPRGAWPLKAIDLDCNHIPDAAMTLAVMALYATAPPPCATLPAGASRKPTASPPWPPNCASSAPPWRKGGLHPDHTARQSDWHAASIHTYDDHRVAMCFSLAAFNPAGLPVRILKTPSAWPKPSRLFRSPVLGHPGSAAQIPVICIDGPTASGKGTVAAAVAQRLGYGFLDSGAMYRITALAASRRPAHRCRACTDRHPGPPAAGALRGGARLAG